MGPVDSCRFTLELVVAWDYNKGMKNARKNKTASTTNTGKTRAVAYLRVSTEKQADAGVSLDAQRAKVTQYAELYDLDLVAIEVDAGASAKSLDRPGLTRALGMLDAGAADALIVMKLDRLTRSVADLGTLLADYFGAKGSALLSVSEQVDTRTSGGRLVLTVLTSVAQWEREAIGERTATAMQHKAAAGEFTGGRVPYGTQLAADGETLTDHAGEQVTIARARELAEGGLSLRKIAAQLVAEGHAARNGGAFAAVQVSRMVANG